MKKMRLLMLLIMVSLLCVAFPASAELLVIGTANYQGEDYKLIHMSDGPFGPVTWLDYTNGSYDWGGDIWWDQFSWVAGLGSQLGTITPAPGYEHITSIDWSTGWRLPETVDKDNSEMRSLYYELGNTGDGLDYTGDFENLQAYMYYSGGEPSDPNAWVFYFDSGNQYYNEKRFNHHRYGLAVHPGEVSAAVPEPGTFLLFGAGLAGLGAWRNKFRRRLR